MEITEDSLRRYIRGQLSPQERRGVTRWIVGCTDPELPILLQGLIREHDEEQADERLRNLHPSASIWIDTWAKLLERGKATWREVSDVPHVPAHGFLKTTESPDVHFHFRGISDSAEPVVIVDLFLDQSSLVLVLATTDQGKKHLLVEPGLLPSGTHADITRWQVAGEDGRVTFWLAHLPDDQQGVEMGTPGALQQVLADMLSGRIKGHAARLEVGTD